MRVSKFEETDNFRIKFALGSSALYNVVIVVVNLAAEMMQFGNW